MPSAPLNFRPTGNVSLDVTNSSSRVALANGDVDLLLTSSDSSGQTLYWKTGDSTVVATTSDTPLTPGDRYITRKGARDTHIAAITESSTAKLKATSCQGG